MLEAAAKACSASLLRKPPVNADIVYTFLQEHWGAVIGAAGLGLAVYQAWATRTHNRHSVRPLLNLGTSFRSGSRAGLLLTNVGLGPAAITKTILTFDGKPLGEFSERNVNIVRSIFEKERSIRPHATTLGSRGTRFLGKDYQEYLLFVEPYNSQEHQAFCDLVRNRIKLLIHYESLYGGEDFTEPHPHTRLPNEDNA